MVSRFEEMFDMILMVFLLAGALLFFGMYQREAFQIRYIDAIANEFI